MKLNMWHFDWVQYTVRGSGPVSEDSLQRAFFNDPFSSLLNYVPEFIKPFLSESDFYRDKGTNGYTFSYSCSSGFSVFYGNPDNVSMGINFRFSGSFLSRILPTLDDDFQFAKWLYNIPSELALKGYNFRLTRLDFAFDCNTDFSYFVDSFDKGEYRCAARSNIYKVVNKDNRGTIYFGSRQSSKMIRIYDKIQERIDSLTGDDLNEFLNFCNDNNYESITRIEIQCRENHSSPAASKALEQFYYGDIGAFLLAILEFGYYEGYDHNNHPAFIRFDWYEEQILNFVQCGVKVPFVQATDINFEWLVSVFGSQLVTLERQAPDLLEVIRDKASISQALSKKLKKYQSSVIKFVDRHKNGFDEDIPLSSEDSFFDE